MKTFSKTFSKTFLIAIATLAICSCGSNDNDPTNPCETLNSPVVQAMATFISNTTDYIDEPEWMDLETHEYTIQINTNGEICSIGYQNPSTYNGSYTMEITAPGGTYSGVHAFSQTATQYIAIPPITVISGDIIVVKRTIQPGYTLLNETVGRTIRRTNSAPIPFPLTVTNITFISSSFYGAGGPVPNIAIPYIALGFTAL